MPIIVNLPSRGAELSFPDGTTPEQIQAAVDRDFPRAGQDVAYDLHDSDFHKKRMTLGDYQMFREHNAANEKSAGKLIHEGAAMFNQEMSNAFKHAWKGVKDGDILEVGGSAFMGSMVGVFDIGDLVVRMLAERKQAPNTYDEFLKDENLKADNASREKYDKLMQHDFNDFKDQMDRQGAREALLKKMPYPEVSRGATWADPTIIIPVVGLEGALVKTGAKLARGAGRVIEVGGRGVAKFGEGAGRVVTAGAERVGAGIERATGLAPAQAATAARYGLPGGAAMLMGGPVAGAAIGTGVTVAPRVVGATGRVIEQAGIGLQQGVGRAGFFGGAAGRLTQGTLEHGLARGLSLLDRPLAYGVHGVAGASIGAGFGGALGGLAEGREGFWHGVGAGGMLGGLMGFGMHGISDVAGWAGQQRLHADLQNTIDALRASGDEAGALAFEKAKSTWDDKSLAQLTDARSMTKRHHWHYVDDAAAKAMTDGAGFEGYHTVDRGDGTADVFINVDKLPFNKDGKPISSAAGEELFHSLINEDVKKEFVAKLQTDLLGIEGYQAGLVHPWELRTYGEAYGNLLKGQDHTDFMAALDAALPKDAAGNITVGDRMKLLDITEEWGAGYFREWLQGKPRDYLLDAGRLPLLTNAFDRAKQSFLTTRRDTLNEAGARFDFRSGDIRKGFYDEKGKRIRMPLLDKMMQDFVRAKRTGEVPKVDSTIHTKINLKKIGGEKAAILMEQQGSHMVERLPDGTARVRKVEEVKAIEKEQSDMFLEAIERDAPETGALIREDGDYWRITMTDESVKRIMNHPMIDDAFKQRLGQVMESIFGQGDIFKMSYWSATESKHANPSNRVYNSLGLSERKVRFYDLRVNKKGGIYTMSADWSILEKRMNKLWGRADVKALFDSDRVQFNKAFGRYLENLTNVNPETNKPYHDSAQLFGVKQRDIFRDAVGPREIEFVQNPPTFEAIGSKSEALNAFKSFRIDRMSRLDQTGEAMPFTGETYGRVKRNLMPDTAVDTAYRVAVEAGDLSAMQRLVDRSARATGFNLGPVFHGSRRPLDKPSFRTAGHGELGDHYAASEAVAQHFAPDGGQVYRNHLSLQNPLRLPDMVKWNDLRALDKAIAKATDVKDFEKRVVQNLPEGSLPKLAGKELEVHSALDYLKRKSEAEPSPESSGRYRTLKAEVDKAITRTLRDMGHDGIVYLNRYETFLPGESVIPKERKGRSMLAIARKADDAAFRKAVPEASDSYIVFDAEQVKSAEPYTVDDAGQMIPLGRRFDRSTTDYRFMPDVGGQDALGMFSAAERATVNLKQEKGTASQMLAMIKRGGVKDEELQVLGLDKFLEGNRRVTKDEIIDHLVENQITVEETVLGERQYMNKEEYRDHLERLPEEQVVELAYEEFGIDKDALRENIDDTIYELAEQHDTDLYSRGIDQETTLTKHSEYVEPGAVEGSYRELLLRLPPDEPGYRSVEDTDMYTGGHYGDYPNTLAHVRFNDRVSDHGKTLNVEEFQSDWHQEGRKKGYASGVPDAPFKTSWHELAMKRMIRYAVDNGYDALSWTKGETQFNRYGSQEIAWVQNGPHEWKVAVNSETGQGQRRYTGNPDLVREVGLEVSDKPYLRKLIEDTLDDAGYSKENFDKRVNKLTDSVWDRMQTEEHGSSMPRKEGMQYFYDRMLTDRKFWKKLGLKVETDSFDTGDFRVFRDSHKTDPYRLAKRHSPDIISRHPTAEAAWAAAEALGATPVHIVRLTPEVKAKVLDGGLARFMPDSGAPNTSRNALGWSLIQSKVGKWHVYRPDGTLAGIGGNKRSAESLFKTHYKRELRKSDRDVKTRFMPDTGESNFIESAEGREQAWSDLHKQAGDYLDKHYDDIAYGKSKRALKHKATWENFPSKRLEELHGNLARHVTVNYDYTRGAASYDIRQRNRLLDFDGKLDSAHLDYIRKQLPDEVRDQILEHLGILERHGLVKLSEPINKQESR